MNKNFFLMVLLLFGVSSIHAQTRWTGASSTDWGDPANWNSGTVPDATTDVIIHTSARYPVLSGNVTIKSLVFTSAASPLSLDVAGHTLAITDKFIVEYTANPRTILSSGSVGTINASGVVKLNTSGNIDIYAKCEFNMSVVSSNVSRVTFHEVVEAKYTNNDWGTITEWRGNIFKKDFFGELNGKGRWRFGTSIRDVFEANCTFDVIDNTVPPPYPPDRRTIYYNATIVDPVTITPYVTPDYIAPPYYVPNSGDITSPSGWSGEKVGFPNYPRLDNYPTNTADASQNTINGNKNTTNADANAADIQISKDNYDIANQYPRDAKDTYLRPASSALYHAVRIATNYNSVYLNEPAYINDEGSVRALYTAFQAVLLPADAYKAVVASTISATDDAFNDRTNTPAQDVAVANNALLVAQQALTHQKKVYEAFNALNAELKRINTAFNTSLAAAQAEASRVGALYIGYNTPDNEFRGNTLINIRGKAQVNMFSSPNAHGNFVGDFTVNNFSTGGPTRASFTSNGNRSTKTMTYQGNVILNNGNGTNTVGHLKFHNFNGPIKINGNVELNGAQNSGHLAFGDLANIEVDGSITPTLEGQTFTMMNVTSNTTTPITFHAKHQCEAMISGTTTINAPVTIIDDSERYFYVSTFNGNAQRDGNVTFNGDVTLRNAADNSNNNTIMVAQYSDVFFNGNILIENTVNTTDFRSSAIYFGLDRDGFPAQVHLAAGKTIGVGPQGFGSGNLVLDNFHQHGGGTPQSLILKGAGADNETRLSTKKGTIFESPVNIEVAITSINNTIFREAANIKVTRSGRNGGNTFDGNTFFHHNGEYIWSWGEKNPDIFNGNLDVKFDPFKNGRMRLELARNSAGNVINGDVNVTYAKVGSFTGTQELYISLIQVLDASRVKQTNMTINGKVNIDAQYNNNNTFISMHGKTILNGQLNFDNTAGSSYIGNIFLGGKAQKNTNYRGELTITNTGTFTLNKPFEKGHLHFNRVTNLGTSDLVLELGKTQSTNLFIKKSNFLGRFVGRATQIQLQESVFKGAETEFERWDSPSSLSRKDECYGGNVFKDNVIIKSSTINWRRGRAWVWAKHKGDTFEGNVTYVLNSDAYLVPALNDKNYYKKNIFIQGTHGRNLRFSGYPGVSGLETNDATQVQNSGVGKGEVIMGGASDQMISNQTTDGRNAIFRKLVMKQTGTDTRVTIDRDLTVTEYMQFINGKFVLDDYNLTILNHNVTNSVSVESYNSSYVIPLGSGKVIRTVSNNDSDVLFPVGGIKSYTPAVLKQHSAGVEDIYTVRLLEDVYQGYDANHAPNAPAIPDNGSFVNRTWVINETVKGGSNCDVSLQWSQTDHQTGFDPSHEYVSIVHYNPVTNRWRCTNTRGASAREVTFDAFRRSTDNFNTIAGAPTVTTFNDIGVLSVASIDATVDDDDLKLCGNSDLQISANELAIPFQGTWTIERMYPITSTDPGTAPAPTADIPTFSDEHVHNPIVSNLKRDHIYVFRWTNSSLEGDCGTDIFSEVKVMIGDGSIPGVTLVTWDGSYSDDWSDCRNWTPESIPTSAVDVIIPDRTSTWSTSHFNKYDPVIRKNGFAKSITMNENSSLTNKSDLTVETTFVLDEATSTGASNALLVNDLNPNVGVTNTVLVKENLVNSGDIRNAETIRVLKDFENNGNITTTDDAFFDLKENLTVTTPTTFAVGDFKFSGASAAQITGSGITFHNMIMDKDTPVEVDLNDAVTVKGRLTLIKGLITPKPTVAKPDVFMIVAAQGISDAGNEESYVNGAVRKMMNPAQTSFIFPTGKGRLGRIALQDINGVAGEYFTAQYFPTSYSIRVPEPVSTTPFPELNHVSSIEYWTLDRVSGGTSSGKVQLFWTDYTFSDIKNPPTTDLLVARFNSLTNMWENRGGTVGGQDVTTPNVQNKFSPWTFASLTGHNPLPVRLLSFDGQKINGVNRLNWTTENDPITLNFEVQRSTDSKHFETFTTVKTKELDNPVLVYKVVDPIKTQETVYYRLKLIDRDGTISYSKIISIGEGSIAQDNLLIYPNPFTDQINVEFDLEINESYVLVVKDMLGHEVHRIKGTSQGSNKEEINLEHLPKGTYVLQIVSSKSTVTKKIVKN